MIDWQPQSSCSKSITSSNSHSKVSLANQETSSISNNWKQGLDLFSQLNTKAITDKYEFLSNELQCSFYSYRLSPDTPLSRDFAKGVHQLPASYNATTKEKYHNLISTFGTHYITQAQVGGRLKEVTAIRTCQVAMNSLKISDVKDCLELESANTAKGGRATLNLFDEKSGGKPGVFSAWMESLKTIPDLVTFSLKPIHNLVRFSGPQKDNLKIAVSNYINGMALHMKCSCSGNAHQSHNGDCSCFCPATKYGNSDCCPTNKGLAHLVLNVDKASGLYGDYFGKSDAYVIFKFDDHEEKTKTVWNNDNPAWKDSYPIGMVELSAVKKFTIEVWDEDYGYDDDLLGKCSEPLMSEFSKKTCRLDYGTLSYSLRGTFTKLE
ncbi:hypothetical protein XELAEV_18001558mg [Xenopus laevis]|nr:hypothetical protein XELAEV_18001558mg [Xenopus laevis]